MSRVKKTGKVYLVGAGPGDAGLITVRGLQCIQLAEIIVYDNLVNPSLLKHAQRDAEIIFAGKLPKKHTMTQDEINRAEWENPENWSDSLFRLYFSKRDSRVWVQKRGLGLGWTINLGHRQSVWWLIGVIVGPPVLTGLLRRRGQ